MGVKMQENDPSVFWHCDDPTVQVCVPCTHSSVSPQARHAKVSPKDKVRKSLVAVREMVVNVTSAVLDVVAYAAAPFARGDGSNCGLEVVLPS